MSDLDRYQALSLETARALAQQLAEKPDSCLGLPTGRTPLGCYEILAQWSKQGRLDWSKAKCFALDDYLDCEEGNSFAHYLDENLYRHTNLPAAQRFNPRFVDDYDGLIAQLGGLDLTIIGIGSNGHIAFNEPGTAISSWTHCIWLTESTRRANAPAFGEYSLVPYKAITIGIATILASRKLILIASPGRKKDILTRALVGQNGQDIPACFLQNHPHLTVLADFDFSDGRRK